MRCTQKKHTSTNTRTNIQAQTHTWTHIGRLRGIETKRDRDWITKTDKQSNRHHEMHTQKNMHWKKETPIYDFFPVGDLAAFIVSKWYKYAYPNTCFILVLRWCISKWHNMTFIYRRNHYKRCEGTKSYSTPLQPILILLFLYSGKLFVLNKDIFLI